MEAKFDIRYTESLLGEPSELTEYHHQSAPYITGQLQGGMPTVADVTNRLENPLASMAVCYLGEDVGHGLITLEDIPEGTVLFLYSGTVCEELGALDNEDNYQFPWIGDKDPNKKKISANKAGGLARFMQHLPIDKKDISILKIADMVQQQKGAALKQKGIKIFEFIRSQHSEFFKTGGTNQPTFHNVIFKDPSIASRVAKTNVNSYQVEINGYVVLVFTTMTKILKDQQIGIDYGLQFWEARKCNPRLFYLDGSLIPTTDCDFQSQRDAISTRQLVANAANKNPKVLYDEGVKLYQDKKYTQAITRLTEAQEIYNAKLGEKSIEAGTCISTIASCLRDRGSIKTAVKACEMALDIFSVRDAKDLHSKTVKKYYTCLDKMGSSTKELFAEAEKKIQTNNIMLGIILFQYILERNDSEFHQSCIEAIQLHQASLNTNIPTFK